MKERASKTKTKTQKDNLVIVTFAEDMDQAREYEALLKSDDIPVEIHDNTENIGNSKNLILMVPEEYIDEAHVVIESQNAYEDFYEFTDDNDDDSFGIDFFDEDF